MSSARRKKRSLRVAQDTDDEEFSSSTADSQTNTTSRAGPPSSKRRRSRRSAVKSAAVKSSPKKAAIQKKEKESDSEYEMPSSSDDEEEEYTNTLSENDSDIEMKASEASQATKKKRNSKEQSSSKKNAAANIATSIPTSLNAFSANINAERKNFAESCLDFRFEESRVRKSGGDNTRGIIPVYKNDITGVVYWMSRDQRVQDNWALIYAQKVALQHNVPLHVIFCLVPTFLNATLRQYDFMLKGLEKVESELSDLQINFHLLLCNDSIVNHLPQFIDTLNCNVCIVDFSPLRIPRQWVSECGTALLNKNIHLSQIDTHNIVPVWIASPKQEYAARTIRPKIHKKLDTYFTEFPPIIKHTYNQSCFNKFSPIDWKRACSFVNVDNDVKPVEWAEAGSEAGIAKLYEFISERLEIYSEMRNNPCVEAVSELSPWFHFGQLSAQRAALEVNKFKNKSKYTKSVDGFIEESIVRRELSDNYCFYQKNYDKIEGASDWAQESLRLHWNDKRDYEYTFEEFSNFETNDDLWNAAQRQLVKYGKMHGFLRMYWAKKILEWTKTPKQALEFAILLNDKYSLDGRDPNGYVGCMWSIAGLHDQGWKERAIFGKIRYMNYQGCRRKFDVKAFIAKAARL